MKREIEYLEQIKNFFEKLDYMCVDDEIKVQFESEGKLFEIKRLK